MIRAKFARMHRLLPLLIVTLSGAGCAKADPPATTAPSTVAAPVASAVATGVLQMGAPIGRDEKLVALSDVARSPATFKGKTITTAGTVTAVCQSMGCWMEIKDATSEAHIKMAGHNFFVPKTAAGHHARVQGTLVPSDDANAECNEEAKNQMGHAVAKVEFEASGVELD